MNNQQVRQWYKAQLGQIPVLNQAWIVEGLSVEERARKAWGIRRNARLRARELMGDPKQVSLLRQRDIKKYGNPDGPTFDYLVAQAARKGLEDDRIYEAIIVGSSTSDITVDRIMGLD